MISRIVIAAIAVWFSALAQAAQPVTADASLRVGASRVDYTPSAAQRPANFRGVLDNIYVRSVVIDNGATRAALISVDAGGIPTDLYTKVSARAASELNIPVSQLLVSATHTHSVPFRLGDHVVDKILQSLREAVAVLQPARVKWGTGASYINVNRDRIDPVTQRWWEGPNYDGNSDKTVAVVRFETPAGLPIAVYYNYAVHAVLTGTLDLISGDIPGASSRYIEESLGNNAVALFSSGAAGDQNPIYFHQTYELRDIRIADYARRGEDISNAMPPGGQGLDRTNPRVQLLLKQQQQMTLSMGQMLGEEVLHVMRESLGKAPVDATIRGAQSQLSCPARRRTDTGRAGYPGTYVDADDVSLRLGALRIGDVYVAAVDAEVYSGIAQRFKRASPFKNTMLSTLTNGSAPTGYVPSDDAFGRNVFTVLSSRLKPGCAEAGIVNGLEKLLRGLEGDTLVEPSAATPPAVELKDNGSVVVPAFTVPLSKFLSAEGSAYLREHLFALRRPESLQDRDGIPALLAPFIERQRVLYPVTRTDVVIAGVPTYIYEPREGLSAKNVRRVLINLHGGGFTACWPACAELESMPIAALGRIKVVSVNYRQGPQYKFPAASQDVAAVYRELLKTYHPNQIGVYGCSAGGLLTAMSLAWLQQHGLPRPGAAGVLCSGATAWQGLDFGGDSAYTALPLGEGRPPMRIGATGADLPYMAGADRSDPLVAPAISDAVMAKFPPTLLVSGTRSFDLSATVHTHAMLTRLGVDARLHVWEGMFHGFFYNPDVPESQEAYKVIVDFFARNLGR
jgi:neutral ceramidase